MANSKYENVKLTEILMKNGMKCHTYITQPEGEHKDGSLPVVFFMIDAIGLRARLYEMADHIASKGYYVIAPNMFYRKGFPVVPNLERLLQPEKLGEIFCQLNCLAGSVNRDEALSDITEFFDYVKQQKQCRPLTEKGAGFVGYCFGGYISTVFAEEFPEKIAAVASYHAGMLASDKPTSPHLAVDKIKCEIYFGHADNDDSMNAEAIKTLDSACEKAKIKYTSEVYKGCAHGFNMSDTLMWNEQGCARHWETLFDLFKRNL
ncbi:carboxymethylenebutenolidase like protein [Tieghemostelium lacteum]|uniref:Carboxymethylenebutenolidase like protein n=1 Tax=Tieghemostelium lacteum TaxID=361077 RepID=A0A151Z4T9_TIELA|nr:carboxymethylenebutenolidase like protein [Tieghemostelium lacteum]|eukprot:KYQ88982.1 carboxymethylenebutenolidase like protein [Tieghemostelium lacteum]